MLQFWNGLEQSYLKLFELLYPIFNNAIVIYLMVFLLVVAAAFGNYKLIKSVHQKRSGIGAVLFEMTLIICEIYLLIFMGWFIIVHFKTAFTSPSIFSQSNSLQKIEEPVDER